MPDNQQQQPAAGASASPASIASKITNPKTAVAAVLASIGVVGLGVLEGYVVSPGMLEATESRIVLSVESIVEDEFAPLREGLIELRHNQEIDRVKLDSRMQLLEDRVESLEEK